MGLFFTKPYNLLCCKTCNLSTDAVNYAKTSSIGLYGRQVSLIKKALVGKSTHKVRQVRC